MCLKKVVIALAAFLLVAVLAAPSAAQPGAGYYELTEQTYEINENRTIDASMRFTLVTGPGWITSITWPVYTSEIYNALASDDSGSLRTEVLPAENKITVYFRGNGIPPRSRLTFNLSYAAGGLVSGSGPEYRVTLGGLQTGDYRHDNYVVIIRGPGNTRLFLTKPQAEVTGIAPPEVRYPTKLETNDEFGGLHVRFYDTAQPVYYKVTLTERLINESTGKIDGVRLDVMLFTDEASWQFSALAWSNYPIKNMYVDEENNWHGIFDLGEISPGATKELRLELIYEIYVYDPGISWGQVGVLAEVPAELGPYLKADKCWESDHAAIKQWALEIVAGGTNAYFVAEEIVKSVGEHLKYEKQENRRGALWAYTNREGDCSEYTDLSIALARAAGLPARAMYGWGYREDNFGGHAWAEFYLPNRGWQPVEPTWPDTLGVDPRNYLFRLDPIHLTRNVRGLISGEAGASITRYGPEPTFKENALAEVLKTSGAAQEFVRAAQYAVGLADSLLAISPSEALRAKQNDAKQALAQAQAATDENQIISHAKSSLQNANEVIRALGRRPTEPSLWDIFMKIVWPWLVIVCALIAAGGIIWKIRSR